MSGAVALVSRMRETVILQEKNLEDNGRGGRRMPEGGPEWIDVGRPMRAEVIPLRGGEALTQGVQRSVQIYRVTMRYLPGVNTTRRLLWRAMGGDVALNIRTCPPPIDRRTLVMTCESGVPG